MFREKVASSGLNHKVRQVLLALRKLFEHEFSQNWVKFYDKMDLPIRMRNIYNIKHRYVNGLKLFLTSLTKLVLDAKARICFTIKENLLLYCRKFSVFIVVVII